MNKRIEQKENRQNQILETALDLFVKKGFAATKIMDIAEAAGMSKGLMFNYFSSKEKLYETLVRSGIQRSKALFDSIDDEPLAFFTRVAEMVITSAKQNSYIAKMFVLINDALRGNILIDELKHSQRENIRRSAALILKGQRCGTIREGDPEALASTFWGAVLGVCQLAVQDPYFTYPEPEWIVSIIKNPQQTNPV
jgi:AcrR family transcriptional regulator